MSPPKLVCRNHAFLEINKAYLGDMLQIVDKGGCEECFKDNTKRCEFCEFYSPYPYLPEAWVAMGTCAEITKFVTPVNEDGTIPVSMLEVNYNYCCLEFKRKA